MMTRKNSRAKRDARELAKATGVKYTVARRATRLDTAPPPGDTSPMAQTARDWAEYTLRDADLAEFRAGVQGGVHDAEVESARLVLWSIDRQLIDEYDGDTRLHSLTFQVEVTVRGLADSTSADALVARGDGEIVEDVGREGFLVLLRPRIADVELVVREENDDWEVSEVASFSWEE